MGQKYLLSLVLLGLLYITSALYEDQTGKYDWRHQYVGSVKWSAFEQTKHKRQIFVATESNVLASINTGGQVVWRHIQRRGPVGKLNAVLYVPSEAGIVTLTGGGRLLRVWNSTTGYLKWETALSPDAAAVESDGATAIIANDETHNMIIAVKNRVLSYSFKTGRKLWTYADQDSDSLDFRWMFVNSGKPNSPLCAIGVVENSHFVITHLNLKTGERISQTPISAVWTKDSPNCIIVSGGHFVCTEQSTSTLQFLTIGAQSSFSATSPAGLGLVQLSNPNLGISELFPSASGPAVFLLQLGDDHHALLEVQGQSLVVKRDLPAVTAVKGSMHAGKYVVSTVGNKNGKIEVRSSYLDGEEDAIYSSDVILPGHHGAVVQLNVDLYEMRGKSINGRVLLKTADEAISFILGQDVVWMRDESLADAVSVELVDLPVSDTEAKFEDEFGGKQGESIMNMFTKRLSTQLAQFQSYISHLKKRFESRHDFLPGSSKKDPTVTYASQRLEVREDDSDVDEEDDDEYLTRDDFSLHKIIIVATKAGKVFGLDSKDGTIVWDHFLPDLVAFESSGRLSLPVFVQRTTAHFPNPPQCNLVGKSKVSGNVISFSFNPITGKPTPDGDTSGYVLPFKAKQVVMLNLMTEEFLKIIVFLDSNNEVHIIPSSATSIIKEHLPTIFLFTADADSGMLSGYTLSVSTEAASGLRANPVWNVQLPTSFQRITQVVGKRHTEHVHSQGRVLGDRSVLYKYLNPNLVAVVTEGEEIGNKPHVSVYLVDVVTGAIIFSADHKRAQGPVLIVHVENWVVYQYWNSRFRRNEISVLELYEGKTQKNSTLFSSLDPPGVPLVERQSYILPSSVQAMAVTCTEKGITSRHILMSLQSGGLLSLPKRFLDPRRPLELKQEHKEEGLIPYLPELPIPLQSIVNYNQSVFGVKGIQTAPAGLESTSLVLVYGLDYYFTHVMPSNLFDVLNEDFDYMFITTVLVGLVIGAIATRRLASLKALREAWR